ncbi:hypothetical protein HRbin13_00351 [bacterium HR13]|nr:hypothetical protein HRbin13_00351 [bacterium HR13]
MEFIGNVVIPPSPNTTACKKRRRDTHRKATHGPKSRERLATPRPWTDVPPGRGTATDISTKDRRDKEAMYGMVFSFSAFLNFPKE